MQESGLTEAIADMHLSYSGASVPGAILMPSLFRVHSWGSCDVMV